MKKTSLLVIGFAVLLLAVIGWSAYQRAADDTYQGMSIIPEQHKDIPLFEGLKPTENRYVIKGNHWAEVYAFYMQQLPDLDWTLEYDHSAFMDDDRQNDEAEGFRTRWTKEGFDGELWIWAHYDKFTNQTKVTFDSVAARHSKTWIHDVPSSVCVYTGADAGSCDEITDTTQIEALAAHINDAMDWEEGPLPRSHARIIDFGSSKVTVLYEPDEEIYLISEKGTKLMKPEKEFLELVNLPNSTKN